MRSFWVVILVAGCGGDPQPQPQMQELPDLAEPEVLDLAHKPDLAKAACVSSGCGAAMCGSIVDNCGDTVQCGSCGADSICAGNQCVPHCGDGAKNGDESDVDCGGATCGKCAVDQACVGQPDCAAGTCDAKICRAGSFTKLTAMPTARSSAAVAVAADGTICVLGGYTSGSTASTKVEAYSPTGNSWSALTSMGTARAEFGAAFGADGKLYAAGAPRGAGLAVGASNSAEVYDPAMKKWSPLPNLAVSRTGGRLVASGGNLLSFGGWDWINYYKVDQETVESFTPGDSQWKPTSLTMLTARHDFALIPLADGSWIAGGGGVWKNNPGYSPSCTGFCPPKQLETGGTSLEHCTDSTCSTFSDFPAASKDATWFVVSARADDGKLYVFGSEDGFETTAWKLDGTSFTRIASVPGPLNGAAVVAGKLYVVGTKDLYAYTP